MDSGSGFTSIRRIWFAAAKRHPRPHLPHRQSECNPSLDHLASDDRMPQRELALVDGAKRNPTSARGRFASHRPPTCKVGPNGPCGDALAQRASRSGHHFVALKNGTINRTEGESSETETSA